MAYYGSTPINQGAAGLGIVPRPHVSRNDVLSIVAPPFAMLGLGQDEPVLVVEESLVSAELPPDVMVAPSVYDPPEAVTVIAPPPLQPAPSKWQSVGKVLSYLGGVGGAYHGYKRNQSAGWAFGWFVFGSALPIFAIPVALAQGFAKPKRS